MLKFPLLRGQRLMLAALVVTVAACTPPRDGPNMNEIYASSVIRGGDAHIIAVSRDVARAANETAALGFSDNLRAGAILSTETIRAGDIVRLNIFENVPEGLLAPDEMRNAVVEELQVDDAGFIFVPYAGRIRAAGNSPEALRRILTRNLDEQTPDPQVIVTRAAGDGLTTSVVGGVTAQGIYPITRPTRTLSGMIAAAGGISIPLETAQVLITRGHRQDAAWLQDIYEHPALDVALRGGDRILVRQDRRAFSVLGATGTSNRVPFDTQTISAIEALATVGGLDPLRADPKGVFVFRDEPEDIARRILGRQDLIGDQRFVYVLDLTAPNGMFNARDFKIRDQDTIFVTEASSVAWSRQIATLTGNLSAASALRSLADSD